MHGHLNVKLESVINTGSHFLKKNYGTGRSRDFRLSPCEVGDMCALLGYCAAYGEDGPDRLSQRVGKELPPFAA